MTWRSSPCWPAPPPSGAPAPATPTRWPPAGRRRRRGRRHPRRPAPCWQRSAHALAGRPAEWAPPWRTAAATAGVWSQWRAGKTRPRSLPARQGAAQTPPAAPPARAPGTAASSCRRAPRSRTWSTAAPPGTRAASTPRPPRWAPSDRCPGPAAAWRRWLACTAAARPPATAGQQTPPPRHPAPAP